MKWKDVITDPDEIKVFMALDGPKYTWRTVGAVARPIAEADNLRSKVRDCVECGGHRPNETKLSHRWRRRPSL